MYCLYLLKHNETSSTIQVLKKLMIVVSAEKKSKILGVPYDFFNLHDIFVFFLLVQYAIVLKFDALQNCEITIDCQSCESTQVFSCPCHRQTLQWPAFLYFNLFFSMMWGYNVMIIVKLSLFIHLYCTWFCLGKCCKTSRAFIIWCGAI